MKYALTTRLDDFSEMKNIRDVLKSSGIYEGEESNDPKRTQKNT